MDLMRKKQFFRFFTDFYDKFENGSILNKNNYSFSDQEKEVKLK